MKSPILPNRHEYKPSQLLCHPAENNITDFISTHPLHLPSDFPVKIFTDGSCTLTGHGSGLCIFYENSLIYTWRHRLNINNSIYQAELIAFKKAILLSTKFDPPPLICTDSSSSLKALRNDKSNSPLAFDIQRIILSLPSNKKPFISGILGNELADQMAKRAARGIYLPEFQLSFPASFLKRQSFQILMHKWQHRWDFASTGRRTFRLIPKVSALARSFNSALTAFLSGHGQFHQYLDSIFVIMIDVIEGNWAQLIILLTNANSPGNFTLKNLLMLIGNIGLCGF
ncbi:uncharacterized protein LOC118193376 [Stegodyphus dumicola]|uniref:uncharacterized protein LOC118193376 n=1 Tax=Stegodyphus dumicola TaxID=202533 RepID=UPI0015B14F23|nr:uncharacterized protein LOC118193376 [Stegodyphus dumicola]